MNQHTHFMPCLDTQTVLHYLTDEPEPHTHSHTRHISCWEMSLVNLFVFET